MTLKRGSKGADVLQLQNLLGGLEPDGIFGKKTEAAVRAFQAAHGLKVDGIVGKQTWAALLGEDEPAEGQHGFVKPVDYKQYDSKWAKKMYSNHGDKSQTIKSSGCGPTAMADIVATLIDSTVTPATLADLSMKWGCRTYSDGTAWSFFPKIVRKGFNPRRAQKLPRQRRLHRRQHGQGLLDERRALHLCLEVRGRLHLRQRPRVIQAHEAERSGLYKAEKSVFLLLEVTMRIFDAKCNISIPLGRLGENEYTSVRFDVSKWLTEMPTAVIALYNQRPQDTDAYPVDGISVRDGIVTWTVTSAELAQVGKGRCELVAIENDVVAKSAIYETAIFDALGGDGDAPEPAPDEGE